MRLYLKILGQMWHTPDVAHTVIPVHWGRVANVRLAFTRHSEFPGQPELQRPSLKKLKTAKNK